LNEILQETQKKQIT